MLTNLAPAPRADALPRALIDAGLKLRDMAQRNPGKSVPDVGATRGILKLRYSGGAFRMSYARFDRLDLLKHEFDLKCAELCVPPSAQAHYQDVLNDVDECVGGAFVVTWKQVEQ